MAVYTDGKHLVADNVDELHKFAAEMGLRPEWFQDHPRHPHYDLTTARAARRAEDAGAIKRSTRWIIFMLRLNRESPHHVIMPPAKFICFKFPLRGTDKANGEN